MSSAAQSKGGFARQAQRSGHVGGGADHLGAELVEAGAMSSARALFVLADRNASAGESGSVLVPPGRRRSLIFDADWGAEAFMAAADIVTDRRPPPGPRGHWLLGSLPDLVRDPLGFVDSTRPYGDVVRTRFGPITVVLVGRPELIEQVLVRQHEDFAKDRQTWRHTRALFGNGLLTSEGLFWRAQRKLAAPAFAGQRLQSYGPTIVGFAARLAHDWRHGEVRDVHADLMGVTLRIAAKTFFDADVEEDVADMGEALDVLTDEIRKRTTRLLPLPDFVPTPGNLRYRRGIRRVERVVKRIVGERMAAGEDKGDLLSMLAAARDEEGRPMSAAQLRDEMVTMLLAGHETTALALSWTLYEIGRHPAFGARLGEELRHVLGGREPTVEDLPRLGLVQAAVDEAMRLYPPAWIIGREAVREVALGEFAVGKRTSVYVSPWLVQRDPRWFPDPLAYRPERWEGDLLRRLPRFAYFPFGGGPRICIGRSFAAMEAVLILATLLQRFRVEWQPGRPISFVPSITLRPGTGVWVRLKRA